MEIGEEESEGRERQGKPCYRPSHPGAERVPLKRKLGLNSPKAPSGGQMQAVQREDSGCVNIGVGEGEQRGPGAPVWSSQQWCMTRVVLNKLITAKKSHLQTSRFGLQKHPRQFHMPVRTQDF